MNLRTSFVFRQEHQVEGVAPVGLYTTILSRGATDADCGNNAYTPSALFSGGCVGGVGEFWSPDVVLFPSAARFAAHRAFIEAASCARRSGERFNFLLGFFAPVVDSKDFFSTDAVVRAADFLAAFNAFADSACCRFRFNLASFSEPSRRRFSSCWILFFNFFGFIIVLLLTPKAN